MSLNHTFTEDSALYSTEITPSSAALVPVYPSLPAPVQADTINEAVITLPIGAVSFHRAPLLRRAAADFVDRLLPLPFLAAVFWPWAIVPLAYDLLADSRGASVGKRLFGLRAVIISGDARRHGRACTPGRSLLRNGATCVARLCYLVPFLVPVGLAFEFTECLLVALSLSGRRVGDLIAGTQVVAAEEAASGEVR